MECPSCHKDVKVTEAQYGALYTCAACLAVYFVNFDGHPEYDSTPPTSIGPEGSIISAQPANGGTTIGMNTAIANADPMPTDFSLTGMYQQTNTEQTLIQSPAQSPLENAISDIQNFGNQNIDANLTFNLRIQGLDTKELIGYFFDSINDSKFGWVAEDIMKSVRNGQCEIKSIKPVSAYILAKRLQFLDLTLDWSFENAI